MAKHAKKSKAKKTTRRRRRISGVGAVQIQPLLLAGAGALLAGKIKEMLTKDPTKTTMVNLAPYAALALGIGLPMATKNAMVAQLSLGLGAAGLLETLKKIAPGIVGNLDTIPLISGSSNRYREVPKLSVNGVGYNLPDTSVYKDSMSVVSGISQQGAAALMPNGSGSANPGY